MLKEIHNEDNWLSYQTDAVPGSLFWFHLLSKETYDNGTSRWFIICEPASLDTESGCMTLGSIIGTKEDAIRYLESILKLPDITRI